MLLYNLKTELQKTKHGMMLTVQAFVAFEGLEAGLKELRGEFDKACVRTRHVLRGEVTIDSQQNIILNGYDVRLAGFVTRELLNT